MIQYNEIFENKNIGKIKYGELLKNHTSMRVGGPCDVMIFPRNEKQLINAMKIIKKNKFKYMVIGNGTNLLVNDRGIKGVIIKLANNFSGIDIEGKYVTALSGTSLKKVARVSMRSSLSGMEELSGIPGTIGGAITMNAGAYGKEIKDIIESVKVLDKNLNIIEIKSSDLQMSYRKSIIQIEKLIVISAKFKLNKGNFDKIHELFFEYSHKRRDKQPLSLPSCGSVFKRPTGYYAGKLIDDSGFRGFKYKGAAVSQKHCGFIVNIENAKCKDIEELIKIIQKKIKKDFNVELETEVKVINNI